MPSKTTAYFCDVCNKQFKTLKKAQECENTVTPELPQGLIVSERRDQYTALLKNSKAIPKSHKLSLVYASAEDLYSYTYPDECRVRLGSFDCSRSEKEELWNWNLINPICPKDPAYHRVYNFLVSKNISPIVCVAGEFVAAPKPLDYLDERFN